MEPKTQFINGQLVGSAKTAEAINPSTGKIIGTFSDATAEDGKLAIEAADKAFKGTVWSRDPQLRHKVLSQMADLFEESAEELIDLLAKENGKTLDQARFEVSLTIPKIRYYASLAVADYGRAAEVAPGLHMRSVPQPIGVAGVIVPWNSPVVLAVRSFAPALAAGCTVAMKLPAQTGLVNALMNKLFSQLTDMPAGVLNSVTESGSDVSIALTTAPEIPVVSYTGSTVVGREIMKAGAPTLKKMSLELGGKSPMIVFDDADPDRVVPVLVQAVVTFTGQFCMTGSRILAQKGIADELSKRLVEVFGAVKVGPADDPSSQMGPMIDAANAARVNKVVEEASTYAEILYRGGQQGDTAFYLPSLVKVDDVQAPIVQKEVFGPVATFEVFETEAEAIEMANATEYGLAASVWSENIDRPLRVQRELDAGTVWTNTWAVVVDQFEEGGFKQSGLGRLNGLGGLAEFQEMKTYAQSVGSDFPPTAPQS